MSSFEFEKNKKRNQNYTIAYLKSSKLCFGIIRKFYQIEQNLFCVIQKLEKLKNLVDNESFESEINKFYCICELTEALELIKFDALIDKCVLIINKDEYFVSLCNQINEHDWFTTNWKFNKNFKTDQIL